MSNNIEFGIRLTADGKDLVNEVKSSSAALDSLSKTAKDTGSEAARLSGETKNLSSAMDMLGTAAKAAAAAFGVYKLTEYATEATHLAARYETLGVAMNQVGKNAGYSAGQMNSFASGLQKSGISMIESRSTLTQMAQAHINLADSMKLARVAQDAAVIGGINSSEAFKNMIYGIQSGQTDVLRTIGINVNFEASYVKLAAQLGINKNLLTEGEKTQARANAVMLSGKDIAGSYEQAMGTAGKQMGSLTRYAEDLQVKIGGVFMETFTDSVFRQTGALKGMGAEMDKLAASGDIEKWGHSLGQAASAGVTVVKDVVSWLYKERDAIELLVGATVSLKIAEKASATGEKLTKLYDKVTASMAATAATIAEAQANATATASSVALANARVTELRAAVLAAEGNVALAITTNGLVPAQARAAEAAAAHSAALAELAAAQRAASLSSTVASSALTFMGGPVGIIIALLGTAAAAWAIFGNKGKEAMDKLAPSTEDLKDRIDKLQKQLKFGTGDAARNAEQLAKVREDEAKFLKYQGDTEKAHKDFRYLAFVEREQSLIKEGELLAANTAKMQGQTSAEASGSSGAAKASAERLAMQAAEYATKPKLNDMLGTLKREYEAALTLAANDKDKRLEIDSQYAIAKEGITKKYADKGANTELKHFQALQKASNDRIAAFAAESVATGKQTDAEKQLAVFQNEMMQNTTGLIGTQIGLREEKLKEVIVAEQAAQSHDAELKARDDMIKKLDSETASIKKQTETAIFEASIIGKTKEQIDLLKASRYDHETQIMRERLATLDAAGACTVDTEALKENIKARNEYKQAEITASGAQARQIAVELEKKSQVEMWKTIESTAHSTWNEVWKGGSNAFTNIGATLKSAVLDLLYQMTLKKWIIGISATATGGAAGAADMFGGSSGGGGLGGLMQAGQTLWSGFAGGMASGMGGIATSAGNAMGVEALSQLGGGMQIAGAGASTAGLSGAASLGSTLGAAIPYVAAAVAIYALIDSFSSSSTSVTGSGLNIRGTVAAPQTSGYTTGVTNDSTWWGMSSNTSNWRIGSTADAATSTAINDMFAGIAVAINMAGTSIGRDTAQLDAQIKNYTISIGDLSLAGMNAAQQQAAITAAVSGVADQMVASLLPGMGKFKTSSETLLQTLVRVATEVVTLNTFYAALGTTTRATTDSADRMIVALGGIQQASQHMTGFVQAFAPEIQKTALALGTLKSAGLPMAEFLTTTQAWWDFAKTASADQLTAILANQTAITAYVAAMDKAAQATQANIKTLQDKSIADFNAAVSATNALRAFADSVRALQQSLWAGANSPLASGAQADQLRARFISTNVAAASGDVAAQGNLSTSATSFLDAAKKQASSAEAYARDFAFVQNSLADTATRTDVAVTAADKQLSAILESNRLLGAIDTKNAVQNNTLDFLLTASISSTEAARQAVVTQAIGQAISTLGAAVASSGGAFDATKVSQSVNATTGATALNYVSGYNTMSSSVSKMGGISSVTTSVDAAAKGVADAAAAASLARTQTRDKAIAAAQSKIAAANANLTSNWYGGDTAKPPASSYAASMPVWAANGATSLVANGNAYLTSLNADIATAQSMLITAQALPAFAAGGNHFGGARLVGEYGPEIEVTGPSRIFNADQTKNMLLGGNNTEMVVELRALREEVALLRAENQAGQVAIAGANQKTAMQLDRWNGEGMPPVRLAA